jgi:hypothetical protein
MKYLIIIILLTSCGQVFHYKKFIAKGGKLETIEKTVTINDTIKGLNGKDSIIYREITLDCPEPIITTKWQTRIKYRFDSKRFRDSLKFTKRMYSDSLKSAVKTHRIESRVENNKDKQETKQVKAKYSIWKYLIGLVAGFVLRHLMPRILKRKN